VQKKTIKRNTLPETDVTSKDASLGSSDVPH